MSLRDEAQDQPVRFEPNVREVMRSRALLRDPRFASLWLSHGLALTAQNALLFTLLVVVFKITGNSLTTSVLVLCFILPSIPMGFIVGVVLDRTRKETVLVVTSLVRALGCILFLLFHGEVWTIYLITIGHATAGLFFNPAVISLIPTLVSRDRLVPANSLYNFTLTAAQLAGIVFLAPTIIKTLGADGMFIIAAVMFLSSAALASRLHTVEEGPEPRLPQWPIFGGLPTDFRESWQMLFSDRYSVLALVQLIISSTLVLLFSILIPRYMQDVIGVPPESAAFVFAPTGIGALVGLRFLPWFTKVGKNRVVIIGLTGYRLAGAAAPILAPPGVDHAHRWAHGVLLCTAQRARADRLARARASRDARPHLRHAGRLRQLYFAPAAACHWRRYRPRESPGGARHDCRRSGQCRLPEREGGRARGPRSGGKKAAGSAPRTSGSRSWRPVH